METIDGEDDLLRRILHFHVAERGRVSSAAYKRKNRPDPRASVYLARVSDPARILRAGLPGQRLAALKAAVPRDLGLEVIHEPNDEFYGHCVITGFGGNWKEQCARLAEASRVIDLPGETSV